MMSPKMEHPNAFVCGMLSWAATRNSPLEQWIHFSSNRQLGCSSNKKRLPWPLARFATHTRSPLI